MKSDGEEMVFSKKEKKESKLHNIECETYILQMRGQLKRSPLTYSRFLIFTSAIHYSLPSLVGVFTEVAEM